MPTPLKSTPNIRKHLTKAERLARESAEKGLARRNRISIHAPKWLDEKARKVFDATKRRMRGLNILDNVDTDLLAIYSDAVVKYNTTDDVQDRLAWGRLVMSCSDKLGISATARARLAKKAAEQMPPDELEELLDNVKEFVNRGG